MSNAPEAASPTTLSKMKKAGEKTREGAGAMPAGLRADAPTSFATKTESLQSRSADAQTSQTAPEEIGVIVSALGDQAVEATIKSIGAAFPMVLAVSADRDAPPNDSDGRTLETVVISDGQATAGRVRNAAYRKLKKRAPDLKYVQFATAGEAIDPDWIMAAARKLDRRPELVAIEGRTQALGERSSVSSAQKSASGEVQTCGETAMFRAGAFEAAGGFRGDIAVAETEDLAIRMRRRGGHVWRVDAPMAVTPPRAGGLSAWWRDGVARGYRYAVGAALHGAPPERFCITEQARALVWGGVFPAFVVLLTLAAALCAGLFFYTVSPALVGFAVLAAGIGVYAIRIVFSAIARGPLSLASWRESVAVTLGHFAEFAGVFSFWLAGRRTKTRAR